MSTYTEVMEVLSIRPLTQLVHHDHKPSPFDPEMLGKTLEVLSREIRALKPRQAILEVDLRPEDFRQDGAPRAGRVAKTPGIILTLVKTKWGHDIRYEVGTYDYWDDNLRAVALGLEALRKVDRYGVTKRGEQYVGFKALPAGSNESTMNEAEATEWFEKHASPPTHAGYRNLAALYHPDNGRHGDRALWDELERARQALSL
jgi:hypothetical protein